MDPRGMADAPDPDEEETPVPDNGGQTRAYSVDEIQALLKDRKR